ncbi:apolipoprotein N-acyltransferase [Halpernia sp.]|uniref:apolipoprotein N-acyltransferase n=1 Tax=Halpernia sp. TaxID=2782209 RepID=UPI003A9169A9
MKYLVLSLISAVLFSLSWPTFGIPFFIFFAFVPLLMMEHDISKFSKLKRKSLSVFGLSYLTFMIWNIITTGWLYNALNPDGSHSLLAVIFPVLFNSLVMSVTFLIYHRYKNAAGTYFGLVFFVAIWMSMELLVRSWQFTWPWLNLGNAFADYPKIIQWYDTFGATGGSFWILLINIFAFYTIRIWEAGRVQKNLFKNLAILTVIIFVPIAISFVKYYQCDEKPIGEVNVVLLQPDLNPYSEKYTTDSLTIVNDLLKLAEVKPNAKIDYFIAPETALPGYGSISENGFQSSLILNNVKHFLKKKPKSIFVTGISSHKFYPNEESKSETAFQNQQGYYLDSFNSAVQIIPNKNVEVYHKGKLVPGVEMFPYINVLKPLLGNAMIDLGGTTVSLGMSKTRKVFTNSFNKGKLAPIICYESIYGDYVTQYVRNGANFLAIMSNDSWWGISQGHKQLMAYARLRAIENRREVARAANSGISAHINARGDVLADTIYGDKTALPATIQLYDHLTFYSRTGDLLARISLFTLGFLVIYYYGEKWLARKK